MKVAFIFPGQGSQQPGMGVGLLADPEVAALCRRCSEAVGVDLRRLLTEVGEEELRLTENAQPALCFTGIALGLLLSRRGIRPVATAGHSVGEYAALCVAGALDPEDTIRAVVERGRAMAKAVPAGTTSMAAVLGLDETRVAATLQGLGEVWTANVNTPTQVVIAGSQAGLQAAAAALREAGARRVVPLNVSAAFHSPFMQPAAARLRAALEALPWRQPEAAVISNVDARPHTEASTIPERLERQLYSPVLWAGCVGRLLDMGCEAFLELGPKRTLAGMMRELAPSAQALSAGSPAAIAELDLSGAAVR